MAYHGGESSTSEDYEVLLTENKREFDKTANEYWDGRKAGVPAAPVPSCRNMRSSSTEFDLAKQSVLDTAAGSSAKLKRRRTEDAAADQSDPIRVNGLDLGVALADDHYKCVRNQPEEENLPMRHQHVHQGVQICNRGGPNQLGKINVPNLKQATAGEAGDVGAFDICMKAIDGKFSICLDSGEVLQVLNQVPTRTFAIKVKSETSTVEICWGQGAV